MPEVVGLTLVDAGGSGEVTAGGIGVVTAGGTGVVTGGGTGDVGIAVLGAKFGSMVDGGGVRRRESKPISVPADTPAPVSQSRELGNAVRSRRESPIVPAVALGVPRDVLGSGPVRGFATGRPTLIADESGVAG